MISTEPIVFTFDKSYCIHCMMTEGKIYKNKYSKWVTEGVRIESNRKKEKRHDEQFQSYVDMIFVIRCSFWLFLLLPFFSLFFYIYFVIVVVVGTIMIRILIIFLFSCILFVSFSSVTICSFLFLFFFRVWIGRFHLQALHNKLYTDFRQKQCEKRIWKKKKYIAHKTKNVLLLANWIFQQQKIYSTRAATTLNE